MASFPECILCKKSFRWKGPDPYLLPCLHAVCETCLISGEGRIHCSSCQKDADLEKIELKIDKVRQRLILYLTAKHRPTELLCSHEDDGNQAVCWCQECEEFLCEHCQNMHESFKATRRHEVQEVSEMGTSEVKEESYCPAHKRHVLELMDHDCGVLICYKCKHEAHAGHSTEDITTVSKLIRQEIQEHVRAITDVKNKTQALLDDLRIDDAVASEKEKITRTFDTLAFLVRQRQKEVTLEFHTLLDRALTSHSEERMTLKQHQRISSNILEYTQYVLDHASRSELPLAAVLIREAITECPSPSLHEKEQKHATLTFVNDELPQVKKTISTFSGIAFGTDPTVEASMNLQESKTELQEKCKALEDEVARQKETIDRNRIVIACLLRLTRMKPGAICHLMKSENTGSFILHCINARFNTQTANLELVHINKDGELRNQPADVYSPQTKRKGMFQVYRGTSGTEPLEPADYLQYWETKATIRLNQLISIRDLLLEIALCWEEARDKTSFIGTGSHTYSMCLVRCDIHTNNICRRIYKEGKILLCLPNVIPNRQNVTNTVHYGVVFDYSRRKLAFLDVKEVKVIAVLDNVDTSQPLWPMFGVYNSFRGPITMKLVDGKDIDMTTKKEALILKAIC